MLVTLSDIVTLVRPLQPLNAYHPMLVTGYPPIEEGMFNAPEVDLGTAVLEDEPPPRVASPFETVYVHVMPLTVALSAHAPDAANITTAAKMDLMMFACFISSFPFSRLPDHFPMAALLRPDTSNKPIMYKCSRCLTNGGFGQSEF